MVLRCHFDLYSSRGLHIDPSGDDFLSIDEARRMSRSILLDFASHQFSKGEEFIIVCKIRTADPQRFYLTYLTLLDEMPGDVMAGVADVSGHRPSESSRRTDESEVAYRMSADWTDLRELHGNGFLTAVGVPERAWFRNYIPREERSRVAAAIDHAIQFRMPFNLEHKVIRADDTIGWTRSRALPVVDEFGRISEWVGVAKDVTASH